MMEHEQQFIPIQYVESPPEYYANEEDKLRARCKQLEEKIENLESTLVQINQASQMFQRLMKGMHVSYDKHRNMAIAERKMEKANYLEGLATGCINANNHWVELLGEYIK